MALLVFEVEEKMHRGKLVPDWLHLGGKLGLHLCFNQIINNI